jgi:hypothetical protein
MTPKPWASSTYRRASCSRARAAKAGRSGGLPVIELTPSMHSTRGAAAGPRSSRWAWRTSPERNRCTVAPRARAITAASWMVWWARVSTSSVPSPARACRTPLSMWVRVGRQRASSTPSSSTSSASTCSYRAGLAIPRAQLGMAAPAGQVLGDAGQDLGVEVEAEVVAGGEVGQPLAADPDHAPVDLVQHRVGHGVLGDEPGHLGCAATSRRGHRPGGSSGPSAPSGSAGGRA